MGVVVVVVVSVVLLCAPVAWELARDRRRVRARARWDAETGEALAVANGRRYRWECPRPGCGDAGWAATPGEARQDLYRHLDRLCVFYRAARDRSVA